MADRMDLIIEAAEDQGFMVSQTPRGSWVFRKGVLTATLPPPSTSSDWLMFIAALRDIGLTYPPESQEEDSRP